MGVRGHDKLDKIATILSAIFFLVVFTTFGIISLLAGFLIVVAFVYVMNPGNNQRDPTIYDFKDALKKIECQFIEN